MTHPVVITATPTLFHPTGDLNIAGMRRHLTWLKESGVDAIFAAGTTGEFPTLTEEEKLAVLDVSLEIFGPDRTYFHVGAPSARQAGELAAESVRRGARKLAAVTPYYQAAPEAETLRYYEHVVQAAEGAALFAYLFEARTSTQSEPAILAPLAEAGLVGVKISGESDETVAGYLEHRPQGFTVFSGNDVSFEWFSSAGGDGIISGVSSVYPEPFVALRDALIAGDAVSIQAAQKDVKQAVAAVNAGSLTHLKAGVSARGFEGGPVRSAVAPTPEADRTSIQALAAEFSAA